MIFPVDKIKIKDKFLNHPPKSAKLAECRKYFEKHGNVNHKVVIDADNYLVDGYVGYLILKEKGVKDTDVDYAESYKNQETLYIYGKHIGKNKELVWRIPNTKTQKAYHEIQVGQKILVDARNARTGKDCILPVIVTRMSILQEPPRPGYIKRVVAWNLDERLEEMMA